MEYNKLCWRYARVVMCGAAAMGLGAAAQAATYVLPKSDIIGQIQYTRAKESDNLLKIARRYDVGINAIKAANPGLDPLKLKAGTKITIPSRHILPKGPRQGVVINMAEMRLYYYTKPKNGPALVSTYPISIGPDSWSTPLGKYKVTKRIRKPTYRRGASSSATIMPWEKASRQTVIQPGSKNPWGDYVINVSAPGYVIHGTNEPYSIGKRVERGGVRLYPEDMEVFVRRLTTGTPIRIVNEPFKYGYKNGVLYLELHKPENEKGEINKAALVNLMAKITDRRLYAEDWQKIRVTADKSMALATPVVQLKAKSGAPRGWWLKLASYKTYQTARNLMLKLESLDIPISIQDCFDGKPCTVVAGPFTDRTYTHEVWKKVKWVTRIKGTAVPYRERDDLKHDTHLFMATAG